MAVGCLEKSNHDKRASTSNVSCTCSNVQNRIPVVYFILTGGMLVARRNTMETTANEVNTEPNDELLTVHEVARRLRVDDTTVRRWINNGILEAITLPHSGKRRGYRVKQSTLNELLKAPALPA